MKLVAIFVSVAVGSLLEDEALLQSSKLVGSRFPNGRVCTRKSDCTSDECGDNLRCRTKGSSGETSEKTCDMVDDIGAGRGTPSIATKWKDAKCSGSPLRALVGKLLPDTDPLIPPAAKIAIDIVKNKQVCMKLAITKAETTFDYIRLRTKASVSINLAKMELVSIDSIGAVLQKNVNQLLPSIKSNLESKVDAAILQRGQNIGNDPEGMCKPLSDLKPKGNLNLDITYAEVKQLLDAMKYDDSRKDFFNAHLVPAVNNHVKNNLKDFTMSAKMSDGSSKCEFYLTWPFQNTCGCRNEVDYGANIKAMVNVPQSVRLQPFSRVDATATGSSCLEGCTVRIAGGVTANNMRATGDSWAEFKPCKLVKVKAKGSISADLSVSAGLDLTATYAISGR